MESLRRNLVKHSFPDIMTKYTLLFLLLGGVNSAPELSPDTCDFQESDMCGWQSEAEWQWLRYTAQDLGGKLGPSADRFGEVEGYFMYASASDSEFAEAVLVSPFLNGSAEIRRCFMFYFMKEDEGGITDLEVLVYAEDGHETVVWKWEDGTKVQQWQKGQVELNQEETKNQYKIKVIAWNGKTNSGFVAVDDFELYSLPVGENCILEPSTEAPPTTATTGVYDCGFEDGPCGWTKAGGSEDFRWRVTTPKEEAEAGHQTPGADPNGNEDGHVMYITPGSDGQQTARIQTEMVELPIKQCFMFEYNIDRDGGISTLRILTKDPDSPEKVVWEINKDTAPLPEGGEWPEPAQVHVNARQIIVEAVRGDMDTGYVAMDEFLFWDDECDTMPSEARPGGQTTTSAPSDCYVSDSQYSPIDDIPGQGRTEEESASACQKRCLGISGCSYFSFWDDGGCHLSSSGATLESKIGVTAGPCSCEGSCAGSAYFMLESQLQKDFVLQSVAKGETPIMMYRSEESQDLQLWKFDHGLFESKSSGLVLDIDGETSGHKARVVMWDVHGGANQQFKFQNSEILSERDGTVLDVQSGSVEDGTQVWMYDRNDSPAQKWNQIFLEETTTSNPGTSTSPGGFSNCDFEQDTCGWNIEHDSDFSWIRTTPKEQIDAGHSCVDEDPNHDANGHLVYIESRPGEIGARARIETPMNDMSTMTCMMFEYNMDQVDGIQALRIIVQGHDGYEEVLWDLPSSLVQRAEGEKWPEPGQVALNAHKVIIEAVRGESEEGFAVVDDIFFFDAPDCPILPPEAKPNPTETPPVPTPTRSPGLQDCHFETADLCGWNIDEELNNTDTFIFRRVTGQQLEGQSGPQTDHLDNATSYFLYADAALGKPETQTVLSSPMVPYSPETNICFHFWFAMPKNEGIRTLKVFIELPAGDKTLIWEYQSKLDFWNHAQMEINQGADEFKIVIMGVRGEVNEGYIALDEFEVKTEYFECFHEPEDSDPRTTTPIVPDSTTSSPDSGWFLLESFLQEGLVLQSVPHGETPVIMYRSDSDLQLQLWRFDGEQVVAKNNGMVLDISGGQSGSTAPVIMWDKHGNDNQQFKFEDNEVVSIRDLTALDVKGAKQDPGTQVQMYERNGTPAQKWRQIYHDQLAACDFETDLCGWTEEEGLNSSQGFRFTRQTGQDFIGEFTEGPKSDHNQNKNAYFIYANVSYGQPDTETAITSPVISPGIFCFKFWFDMKHFGGIRAMKVFIKLPDGLLIPVWEYLAHVETWTAAQIKVDWFAEPFQLVITGTRGGSAAGYLAMDDFNPTYENEECSIQPPDAEPHITTPQPTNEASTTEYHPKDIGCSFDLDMCGYEITGEGGFNFSRKNGENFQNAPQQGPTLDVNGSATDYFVHISAMTLEEQVKDDLAISEIQIPMVQAMDHMIECFHFWFAMKRDGTVRTLSIVQQNEDGETHAGAVKIIWNYHSSQVENENWLEGQIEVRAESVMDVYQNYTLRIVAERNGVSEDWAALDTFTFTRSSECMIKPNGAEPASTTPIPTTTPFDADLDCNFEADMCGFEIGDGPTAFPFERAQGKDVSSIDYDHNYNIDAFFLYAHDDSGTKDYTYVQSGSFEGLYHPLECFQFWFYVEGFKATNRNFLNITILYEEAELPDDFIWSFQDSTIEWTKGQVEIRAKELNDEPKDFRIYIVADKPTDLVAFVALDDFVMTRSDICEMLPPPTPDTTTTSSDTTTLPNCDDAFSCDELNTQCIPMTKVCDFNTDCENGRDEKECPNIYLFDDCEAETTMSNCGWENRMVDNLEWVIVAKNETLATKHPIERGGKFLWMKTISEEGSNVAYVHSPMYQQSNIQCIFSFFYYIAGDLGNSPIIPALHLFEGDRQVNLDYLSINDMWQRYEISLGRRISPFEVVFMRENSTVFDAGVAIDDVGFDNCGLPRPQETCDDELASFQCANKACISPDRLCDLSDDCGDRSDEEGLYCDTHTYWQSTFEDDNKPFGVFSPDPDPESFKWKRGSGETTNRGTGPPFDHTTFDMDGHYLYIDSSYDQGPQNAFAEIVSEIFVPDPTNELECRMIFYYHMTGPFVGTLWVSVRYTNGRNMPLWVKSGNLGNKWNREVLTINSTVVNEDYSVVFKATIGKQYQGDIAIDDVTFSPACRPKNAPSTTTPTTTPNGCPGGFQCNNGDCILNTQVCDFHYDCGDGTEDEDGCPTFYSFEDCPTLEDCGLQQVIPDNLDFVITTGEAIDASAQSGRGPHADYENSSTTHFLYAMPKGEDCCSTDIADIQTNQFQNADTRCLWNFYMYISSGDPNMRVYPYLQHTELGFITRLDRIDTESLGDAMWNKVQIGIGRHRDPFKLGFSLIQDNGDAKYDTALAIDEMFMFDCDRLMPSPEGCPENEWQCSVSKACIANTQLCDYSDDCGDGSDEVMYDEICKDFTRTDFENPDQPFGFFNQDDERPEFRWLVGNGSTDNEGTGPPFDHTFFSPIGHYLYIASDAHDKDERAWITSPTIDVSSKECIIRFWYHMHGRGVGNLTVYKQSPKGALEQLWRASGLNGIDENRWMREILILQSAEQFKIVIEASVGEKNKGDIAIDDVSFTPACSFVDITTPTPTKTTPGRPTTTPRKPTTTPWKPPTTHTTPWKPPTTTIHWDSTTEIITPAPSDPHKGSVIIICAVVGAVVVIGLVLVIVVTVYKRGVPSMDSVRSFLNPSYERFGGTSSGDTHMMSLRELTSKEEK